MPFLGVMKLLAVVVLLIGKCGDITVGAYAGLFFYGLGAFMTHATIGDGAQEIMGSVILMGLTLSSYFLWRKTRGARGGY